MTRWFLLPLGLFLVLAPAAQAQRPVSCGCYCGVVLSPPCSDAACKRACGARGGEREFVLPPPDPLAEHAAAYRQLLDTFGRYSSLVAPFAQQPPPASLAELDRRLDALHATLSGESAAREARAELLRRQLAELIQAFQQLPGQVANVRAETAQLQQRTQDLSARAGRIVGRADTLDRQAQAIASQQQQIEWDVRGLQWVALGYFAVFAPPSLQVARIDDFSRGPDIVVHLRPRDPREPLPVRAGPAPAEAAPFVAPRPTPMLTGTIPEKIDTIRALEGRYQAAALAIRTRESEVGARTPEVGQLRRDLSDAWRERERWSEAFDRATVEHKWARAAVRVARENVDTARTLLVRSAVDLLVWDVLKGTVITPEIERFLLANGLREQAKALKDEVVVKFLLDRKRLVADADLRTKSWEAFIRVQEKTLRLLSRAESAALEAAEVAALGSPADMERVRRRVFGNLEQDAGELVRTASPAQVPSGLRKIAGALLGLVAPPPPEPDPE